MQIFKIGQRRVIIWLRKNFGLINIKIWEQQFGPINRDNPIAVYQHGVVDDRRFS